MKKFLQKNKLSVGEGKTVSDYRSSYSNMKDFVMSNEIQRMLCRYRRKYGSEGKIENEALFSSVKKNLDSNM